MLRDLRARDLIDWKENRRESPLPLAGELGIGLPARSVTLVSAVFAIPRGSKGGFFSSFRSIVIDMAPVAARSCVTLLSMGSEALGVRGRGVMYLSRHRPAKERSLPGGGGGGGLVTKA